MYLFDLEANPSETISGDCGGDNDIEPLKACSNLYNNLAFKHVRQKLEGILKRAEEESVIPTMRWMDDGPLADPMNFGGWVPWRDEEGDPLANYAGLSFEQPMEGASSQAISFTGGAWEDDMHQLGEEHDTFQVSPASVSGLALFFTVIAVGSTLLGYRAGRRSAYYHTLK